MKQILRILFTSILIMVASINIYAAPPLSAIQKAKTVVEDARYQLPVEIGNGLILTQVSYDSKSYTLVYRYHYAVIVTKPSSNTINEVKQGMIHLLKAHPDSDEMQILKSGISFHYNYYNDDGTFLYAVKITPSDIK